MVSPPRTTAALFDFDGTISSRDSMPLFMRHVSGGLKYYCHLLKIAPVLTGYLVGLVSNHAAKERLVGGMLSGFSESEIRHLGETFCAEILPDILRAKAEDCIARHMAQGHRVVVVTASMEEWLRPWCRSLGVEIVGTRLEYDSDGIATGRFATPNCHGPEKVRRAEVLLGRRDDWIVYAYGDSAGDREMLAWADYGVYRPFGS